MSHNTLMHFLAKQLPLLFMAALVAWLVLSMEPVPVAQAATFTVNSTTDAIDATPGDGVCVTAEGACTLRAAIQEANALAGADTITLPAGTYTLSIEGTGEDASLSGDLDITDDLTITGAGAADTIIDGGGLDRVFHIVSESTVDISSVTVQGGNSSTDPQFGGGILNSGTLTLTNSAVSNNSAGNAGGGIINAGTLTLTNTIISSNTASNNGGGIYNNGTLTLASTAISDNRASSSDGGGIWNGGGTLTLANSTVSGNTASVDGGGILNSFGILTLTNSTVSGNTATSSNGGGINNFRGTLTLTNSTISSNTAPFFGGGIVNNLDTVDLVNTIIANNSGVNCSLVSGSITSLGNNLDSDGTCGLTEPTDLPNTDPMLGPLQDNGGPTETHALLPASPAIDHIPPENCVVTTDQRGVPRPQGAACDIGAYEFVPPPDTVTILKAIFFNPFSLLFMLATSTASPDADLFVTVPGCVTDAPMRFVEKAGLYTFRSRACTDLDGQSATVTSSFGGSDTAIIQ